MNTKLELGSTSKVHCNAEGQVTPDIKWSRADNKPFPDNVEDKNSILLFKGVTHDDVGYYTCIARSSQGLINATIHIDVVGK